jgi:hypothetical protein
MNADQVFAVLFSGLAVFFYCALAVGCYQLTITDRKPSRLVFILSAIWPISLCVFVAGLILYVFYEMGYTAVKLWRNLPWV